MYYADESTDRFMKHPHSFPRYAGLAPKAISYYLKERYNPETFDWETECHIRHIIKISIQQKVLYGEPYDRNWIDNYLRYLIHHHAKFYDIIYDLAAIEGGYNGIQAAERDKRRN